MARRGQIMGATVVVVLLLAGPSWSTKRNVTAGVDAIQTVLVNTAVSGDTLLLASGTYTFTGVFPGIDFLAISKNFSTLTILSASPQGAILDFSGLTSGTAAIRGRNRTESGGTGYSENIKFIDVVFSAGNPDVENFFQQDSADRYTGWEFIGVHLGSGFGVSNHPFRWATRASKGIRIIRCKTLAGYNSAYAVQFAKGFLASVYDLDLTIEDCDFSLHGASLVSGININNSREVRIIRPILSGGQNGIALSAPASGEVKDVTIVGGRYTNMTNGAAILLDAPATGGVIEGVHVYDGECDNTGRGVEMDSGDGVGGAGGVVRLCSVVGWRAKNLTSFAVAFASASERNYVANVVAENCVTAVHFHSSKRNVAEGIRAINCDRMFAFTAYAGLTSEKCVARGSVAIDCDYLYAIEAPLADSFPSGVATCHHIGKNKINTPGLAFAVVDGVAKTSAQLAALYPDAIEATDEVVTSFPLTYYSTQAALNVLVDPLGVLPQYSTQGAANMLAIFRETGWSLQGALNIMVDP